MAFALPRRTQNRPIERDNLIAEPLPLKFLYHRKGPERLRGIYTLNQPKST